MADFNSFSTDPGFPPSVSERKSDFSPSASLKTMRARSEITKRVRKFFEERDFLEVETPILSADTVVDRYLDPMSLTEGGKRFFLQTSPEFAMKRLLASWQVPIFQIGKVFRRDECGTLHNPEFTMLEFYRPGDDLEGGMGLLDEFQQEILGRGPARRMTYSDAFETFLGLDPLRASIEEMADCAKRENMVIPEGFVLSEDANRDDWLDFLLGERIQARLGNETPVILFDYPASQAALAVSRGDVAERFELYVDGIELANGYHELCDPEELRRRNVETNILRRLDGKECLPEESRLLAAMDYGLPPCAGTAVGLDRLIMLALGAQSLEDILAFPFRIA
ncbi:MAG: EF-P lysine aminoacylase GenX [Thermoguttaceae bacterium]|nr:EF-P lysine aminoacylase GenX [Thermoguttaceae bacterium]